MTVTTQKNSDSIKLIDRRWPQQRHASVGAIFSRLVCRTRFAYTIFRFRVPCSLFFFLFRVHRYLVTYVVFVASSTWCRVLRRLVPFSGRDVRCFVLLSPSLFLCFVSLFYLLCHDFPPVFFPPLHLLCSLASSLLCRLPYSLRIRLPPVMQCYLMPIHCTTLFMSSHFITSHSNVMYHNVAYIDLSRNLPFFTRRSSSFIPLVLFHLPTLFIYFIIIFLLLILSIVIIIRCCYYFIFFVGLLTLMFQRSLPQKSQSLCVT